MSLFGKNQPKDAPEESAVTSRPLVDLAQAVLEVCKHAMELHGGNGTMLEFGIEKLYRDASMYLHMDGTVDITKFKIVKNLFPDTAGKYAGPEA